MINDEGKNVDMALPSTPVEILGMNKSALAGDDFVVVDTEEKAKEVSDYRIEHRKSKEPSSTIPPAIEPSFKEYPIKFISSSLLI